MAFASRTSKPPRIANPVSPRPRANSAADAPSRPVCTTAASSSPTSSCTSSTAAPPRIVSRPRTPSALGTKRAQSATSSPKRAQSTEPDLLAQARERQKREAAKAAALASAQLQHSELVRLRRSFQAVAEENKELRDTKRLQDEELARQAQTMREFKSLQAQLHGERAELARERASLSQLEELRAEHEEALAAGSSAVEAAQLEKSALEARVAELEGQLAAAASAAAAAAAGRDGAEAATERELDAVSAALEATLAGVRGTVDEFARRMAASQAREMELERALQLALSVARRAERRAEVERRLLRRELGTLEQLGVRADDGTKSPAADALGADGLVESLASALTLRRSGFAKENRFMEAAGAMESRRRALRRRLELLGGARHDVAQRALGEPISPEQVEVRRRDAHAAAETMEESIAGLQAQLAKLRDERRVRQG